MDEVYLENIQWVGEAQLLIWARESEMGNTSISVYIYKHAYIYVYMCVYCVCVYFPVKFLGPPLKYIFHLHI